MNAQRGKLVSGGRLQVPAEFRRALGIDDGDTVIMEVKDGELHVRPYREVLRRVQDRLRRYVPEGVSLSDELIAERRAEAERE
ncbi:AbrB/MazE/SpoVT family DNA-binding domain-containing protein [Sphingomonas canadensis]|uniref:AbrB/MazE/SpoVT family DNA-binding domain-containing protein n=1 Tax=Sphingomonas canadensis TaxID=1219257 RepID=A0ABW3HC90_9SPHN|nr:AbrB/MazE/SpoVT family DNA-binding domain-containing protein [Sphingomonas canadensis]MCW3837089.1 AbrB/MazE/SpoVT family DNA-binding domain-containing protein [Sphingomonas canadensis]